MTDEHHPDRRRRAFLKGVGIAFAETMRRSHRSEVMRYREKTVKVDERNFENHDFYNCAANRPS
jgi:hypothetical protein